MTSRRDKEMPKEQNAELKITIEEIYKELCPKCKDKVLSLAAKSIAVDSVKKQLKDQWDK